ncbi:hypothetical protein CHS0354_000532 [Potamilus streckersoni]|uniref:site-specific DNA-methyltransferase (cytosine-N(4)-specific) n=1 Tax=Potamilus streckersoni TaxID=2493646 RepID=A0AAE0T6W1_9BIVA|nr:hypothetical protein CHS0354_000532 [Potamilus streckersoni]
MISDYLNKIVCGDSEQLLNELPNDSINLIITSPPYFGCRVYGNETMGREENPLDYVSNIVEFTNKLKRVLHKQGSFYLNVGDVYFGTKGFSRNKGRYARKTDIHYKEHKIVKPDGKYLQYKQLLMIPERIAMGMQEKGWLLRNKIVWEKPNPVPSYSPDRRYPVYEHIFHFVKSRKYFFDLEIAKKLNNHRDIYRNGIEPFGEHQASFPISLIKPLILTTSKEDDIVLDPFMGSGTTAVAALETKRNYIGFEINDEFCTIANNRIREAKSFESKIPFLYYRVAENVFCKAFSAENLSRDDLAYDARKGNLGIGLKTFIDKGSNLEKVAEFNAFSNQLRSLQGKSLAIKLSELRNARILFANRTYGIDNGIYHCVARGEKALNIFETIYDLIDTENIRNVISKVASITFEDGKNDYSFNFSKTTLYKRFVAPQNTISVDIDILDDPLELILQLDKQKGLVATKFEIPGVDFVTLPLYSLKESTTNKKVVSQKSGLNQWNAGGRKRDVGEVYIPIPIQIHKRYPDFFPDRETPFNLHIPTGEVLNAKVCQENGKALMTNPNRALSDWLLRKVLSLKEGELLTYEKLSTLGIDSVRISKIDRRNFKIDFTKLDNYEVFINKKN